jgi:hypothetical protein
MDKRAQPGLGFPAEGTMTRMLLRFAQTVVQTFSSERSELASVPPIVLSARDAERVVDALAKPPHPSAALEKAAVEYRSAIASGRWESR